ncbi:MAG: efflux RND transporter permease subunit [Salinivirgaceae bacterium]|jgi:multidrug efflux pump subunit AcrB|nr:efflux RND transporter permease subunit [Salinivirgaceae bacterium]
MKKIITYFIKYSVSVNVLILAFIVFGFVGGMNMKSSFFPLVESRMITIQLTYPGASPQEIEEGVVLKIENNLKGLVGIDRFTSRSMENAATITVEALKGYDVDVVLANVKNAVDKVPSFPTGMEPPVVAKQEGIQDVVSFVVSGKHIPLKTLKTTAREIETDFRAMDGVSQIEISGFPLEEIEIAVIEDKLRAYNLSFRDISNAVAQANLLMTGGSVKTDEEEYLIRARNRSYHGEELNYIIVKANFQGRVVYLKDVATVKDRWSETPDKSYYNGEQSVAVNVQSTNSEDFVSIAEKAVEYIENYNETHENIVLSITRNRATVLDQRTKLLMKNAAYGIGLILLFLSLFLKPRIAFWVALGLPISFLGFFMMASYLGITINVLSLFGMIIVVGILVDDGIVIGENIYHHFEKGKTPIRAAIDGVTEVLAPITLAILTTIIAFSTFFFLDGRIGDFFGQVASVVIITLVLSLVEALIILPAHLAHSRALTKEQKSYVFNIYADRFITWVRDKVYGPYLTFFLKNRLLGFAIPIAMFMITIGAMGGGIIRFTFFPSLASDRVAISLAMPQGTSEANTTSIIERIEAAVEEVNVAFTARQTGNLPVVENIIRNIGPGTANASLAVNLLPGEARDFDSDEIASAIQKRVGPVPEAENLNYGSGSNFGGRPVSVSIIGENIAELKAVKEELKAIMATNSKLKNVTDNNPEGIKEIQINLKEKAQMLGVNLNDVMGQVRSGFFGMQVQRFQRGQDEIKVWVRFEKEPRSSITSLFNMRILTPSGARVPLSEIAYYEIERGEIAINHIDGKREIKVEADMASRKESATDATADIRDNIFPDIQARYPSVSANFEGQNREAAKTGNSAKGTVPIILFLVYAIIAFAFKSYGQPLMLILMIPFSFIGVAWGHFIHGLPVNMLSILGIIALIGIVVNDGLVLIEKFNRNLKAGMLFNDALIEAGKSRFRAIFLTSLTTIAGLAPLIFETSRQAQFLIPMAIAVAYGIGIATFLTLLMLPLMLSGWNSLKTNVIWYYTGTKPSRESVERAIKELEVEKLEMDD